jgi:uncharacterized protein YeaO (DUF488 family)
MTSVKVKRVYEAWDKSDGFRILVDRLWPRGIKKEDAHVDAWMKEVSPSNELRKWYHAQHEKWDEFVEKYEAELKKTGGVNELLELIKKHKAVTLLYSSKFQEHNNAMALQEFMKRNLT